MSQLLVFGVDSPQTAEKVLDLARDLAKQQSAGASLAEHRRMAPALLYFAAVQGARSIHFCFR